MKKTAVLLTILLTLVFAFATLASAGTTIDKIKKNKELVVGTSASYPPLTFKAKDGKVYGLDMDLAQAIASAMDVKLRTEVLPFDQLIPALEKGKIDLIISCMTITPQRNLRVAYVGPYFISGQSILTTKDAAGKITSVDDINKPEFSIAVPQGTTTVQIAKKLSPKAKFVLTKSTNEALDLLLKNKVNALMADYPYVATVAMQNKDKGLVANSPFTIEPLGIAVRQGDPLFVNFLDNYLNMLRGDGFIKARTLRWFNDDSWIADLP